MDKILTLDLFAGIGGIRKGFEATGYYATVYANDFDRHCKLTYDKNFDTVPLTIKDIRKVSMRNGDVPEFDFILAGFPCQPFSVGAHGKGFADEKGRGTLFEEIERLLSEAEELQTRKPLGFLLENVKNLKGHDGGRTYKIIHEKLSALGYYIEARVYNSLDFGLAQSRERIFIVGFSDPDVMQNFRWPTPPRGKIAQVKSILDKDVDPLYYYNGKPLFDRISAHVINPDSVYTYRRNYIREQANGYSPTLVASMGQGGHNVPIVKDSKGIRRLTPEECARLQGYDSLHIPVSISDQQIYKQIGNSVPIPVVRAIAQNVAMAVNALPVTEPSLIKQAILAYT